MLNIVLFGPPGAGKGTQAAKLIDKYKLAHISTGDVIRAEIRSGSELGRSVEEYTKRGELVPDRLVIDIIADYVVNRSGGSGSIFDGFPRTTYQAEEFDKILAQSGMKVDFMVSLDVEDAELVKRLLLRGKESGRADDSSEEVIRNRISVYKAQTAIVADYYSAQGKYMAIDGIGTIDEIFDRICKAIEGHR